MRRFPLTLILIVIGNTAFAGGQGAFATSQSPRAKLRSVPREDVRWTTGFWADRLMEE